MYIYLSVLAFSVSISCLFFPFVIGCRCPGVRSSSEKSTIFCADIRPEVEPRKFGLCKPCYFASYPLCPRYQDFEQRISRYIVTSFAVNVTLEVAVIYDLITRLNLAGLSTIKEFFLERRELFLRTA